MAFLVRYVHGPLKGQVPEQAIRLSGTNVITLGNKKKSRFQLPAQGGVQPQHAVFKLKQLGNQNVYTLQPREGVISIRQLDDVRYHSLEGKEAHAVIEHGMHFKIGPHTFKIVDPAVEKLPFWERPVSRRKFVTGATVGAVGATAGALSFAGTNPFMRLINWLSQEPASSHLSSFVQRVALGAHPLAFWRSSQGRDAGATVPAGAVHYVPHTALEQLGRKSGVKFSGNQVFIRLNQDSQRRWMTATQPARLSATPEASPSPAAEEHRANRFFNEKELGQLGAMMNAGIRPHFVLEPTEGLFGVPKYQSTLDVIAKDISEFGPVTLQFAPGLNSPNAPYYWKNNSPKVEPKSVVREAFKSVHRAFGSKPNVSLVFSPLLPHDPAQFSAQADEIGQLAKIVKPYVSGAGGLFYPNSLESVQGLDRYADVLKQQKLPFVGLDGFATRGARPFEESLKRFKDSRISRQWTYLNFSDVPNTPVEKGSQVMPWTLTPEKLRMIRETLGQ